MSDQLQNNKKVTIDAGIAAGNDVSVGDITGQQAIGKYINQINLQLGEMSVEELIKLMDNLNQKRKDAANLEILNCYNPSALPEYPLKLKEFVTRNRVEEINKAFIYLQNHRILLLKGIGGIGKTTLARALVDIRPAPVPLPFWFDFRQNEDAKLGDILEKLAGYMNSPDLLGFKDEKREPEKKDIDKLTDKLRIGPPVWLIFDNLETLLDDIYFHKEYMDLFFTCLHDNTHQAKIILTSRVFPKLRNGEDLIDVIGEEKQDVKGLKINFAVEYLAGNGLDKVGYQKLMELATGVDGHPLALKLLVKLVKDYGSSDILNDLSIYLKEKVDTIKKAKKLFDKLAGTEKELLERVSVYREPVKLKGLKEMFIESTSKNAVKKLLDKSLLETDHNGNYWLHPLVQEFSYEDLKNKKEAHLIAYNYYKPVNLPENPTKKEHLQPAIEAHYHACEAGEYDLAADIIWKSNLNYLLDLWGNQRTLIEIYEKLLPKDHFKDEPIIKEKKVHGNVLGNLALAYRYLGELKKAIEYSQQALKMSRETGDRRNEGAWLGNMGLAYSDLGDVKKAIKYYDQALIIARDIGDRSKEGGHFEDLGLAYSHLGEPTKAIENYEDGLRISREIGDKRREGNCLGNLGVEYIYLGDTKKAIEYSQQALIITRDIGHRRGEGNHLRDLGVAYGYMGELKKAIEYSEQALKIAREIGNRRGEGNCLGNIGSMYIDMGETRKAIEYSQQALIISKEMGYRRGEGNHLGNLGLAYSHLDKTKKAIEYYKQALEIIRDIGNRRGEGRLLGSLGVAYRDLRETRKAIEYSQQALIIAREIGHRRGEGNHLVNLGLVCSDLGEIKKAIEYYEQALIIAREISDKLNEGICLGNLGSAYSDLGETKKAIKYHEQALIIAREIGNRRGEGRALGSLGLAYSDMGETKKAIEFLEKSLAIGKSIEDPRIQAVSKLFRIVHLGHKYRNIYLL